MKLTKKTKLILIIVPIIILFALMGFAWAAGNNENNGSNSKIVTTRPHSSVILKQREDDLKKVDVYLGMADDSSIASFQIGLNVDISDDYKTDFEWSQELSNNKERFKDVKINAGKAIDTEKKVDRINIYYTGTNELNQLTNTLNVDNVKVGTITFTYLKEDEEKEATFMVRPVGISSEEDTASENDFTKTVSLSHDIAPVIVESDDILYGDLLKVAKEPETEDPGTQDPGTQDPGTQDPGTQDPGTQDPGTQDPGTQDPETQNPGTQDPGTQDPGTQDPGTQDPGTQNPETGNSGNSNPSSGVPNSGNNNSNNSNSSANNNGSIVDRVISAIKTGANRSNVWIIVVISILAVIAGVIIFIIVKGKKSRH